MRHPVIMLAAAGAVAAALPAAPSAVRAQDMEVRSELSGVALPPAYYERVRETPHLYRFRRPWRAPWQQAATDGAAMDVTRSGTLRMVVLLGLFADSPEPSSTGGEMHELLFGDNPRGSLTDYYRHASSGRVTVTGAVLPWVRSSYTRAQVGGGSYGLGTDAQLAGFLREILRKADQSTDFGQFDNDGPDGVPNSGDDDGIVDLPSINFEGPDATCGADAVWPHMTWMEGHFGASYATNDRTHGGGSPILIDHYIMQSATRCDGSPQDINVIAHEAGHAFGLPDFYDSSMGLLPGERHWVLGCWTLMAAGSWGCGAGTDPMTGSLPTQMGAWEKLWLGWATAVRAEPGWRRQYTLRPVQESAEVLRVPLRGDQEYLLLEYRPRVGFDVGLPAGGVLVYQVDSIRPLSIHCNGCERIYKVGLIEADGDDALVKNAREGGNRGVAGDVWTGRRTLDALSTPALTLNSGMPANVALEIEVLGPEARITVSTLPFVAPAALLAPVLGSAGAGPTAEQRLPLDFFGNRDGRYDLGDLRAYMRGRPNTVVPPA